MGKLTEHDAKSTIWCWGTMKARLMFCSLLLSWLGVITAPAQSSETLAHHGTYRAWKVFQLKNDTLTACYAATKASRYHSQRSGRKRPVLYIVRYPKTTASNTLEIRFGQDMSQFTAITAKLIARRRPPQDSFPLTVKKGAGFIASPSDQSALITAMRKGRQLQVVSEPVFSQTGIGETLEDRYSLFGYTKAMAKLEELCPGPKPVPPPAPAADQAASAPENASPPANSPTDGASGDAK